MPRYAQRSYSVYARGLLLDVFRGPFVVLGDWNDMG